jgi:hypothetical protein
LAASGVRPSWAASRGRCSSGGCSSVSAQPRRSLALIGGPSRSNRRAIALRLLWPRHATVPTNARHASAVAAVQHGGFTPPIEESRQSASAPRECRFHEPPDTSMAASPRGPASPLRGRRAAAATMQVRRELLWRVHRGTRNPRVAGLSSRRGRDPSPNKSRDRLALLDPAGCSSLIAPRQVA